MSGPPPISIALATHNRADRLEALFESLRAQTYAGEFEVVVVDDGSSDRTPEVLAAEEARGELRLRTQRMPESRGPAAARNAACPGRTGQDAEAFFANHQATAQRMVRALGLAPGAAFWDTYGGFARRGGRLRVNGMPSRPIPLAAMQGGAPLGAVIEWQVGHDGAAPRRMDLAVVTPVPMRSGPASPESSAARSACAAWSRAAIASAWRSRSAPASVSETGRGPPGRSISRRPTIRSSMAICWLIADCV